MSGARSGGHRGRRDGGGDGLPDWLGETRGGALAGWAEDGGVCIM